MSITSNLTIQPEKEKIKTLKIMIIGEAAVGKSSLMYRYTMNSFSLTMLGTAGIDFKKKQVTVEDIKYNIILYDTAGHDRFRKIVKNHCKGADGILLVYDISEKQSIERLSAWMEDIEENTDKDVEVVLVANKSDIQPREISKEKGKELGLKYNIPVIETSAKTSSNVDQAFDTLINNIIRKEKLGQVDTTTMKTLDKIDNKSTHDPPPNNIKKKKDSEGCQCIIF